MAAVTETTTQSHSIELEATPEAIWDALTTSQWTQRYGYGGRVEYDLRPGGTYRAFASPEMASCGAPEVVVDGEVVHADAPRRLVQTWNPRFGGEVSAEPATWLTFNLDPLAEGVTRLTITHDLDGAPRTAAIVGGAVPEMGGGWDDVLADLKSLLETGSSLDGR